MSNPIDDINWLIKESDRSWNDYDVYTYRDSFLRIVKICRDASNKSSKSEESGIQNREEKRLSDLYSLVFYLERQVKFDYENNGIDCAKRAIRDIKRKIEEDK